MSGRAALALLGCDVIQGYLISRPLPMDDLLVLLEGAGEAARDAAAA